MIMNNTEILLTDPNPLAPAEQWTRYWDTLMLFYKKGIETHRTWPLAMRIDDADTIMKMRGIPHNIKGSK